MNFILIIISLFYGTLERDCIQFQGEICSGSVPITITQSLLPNLIGGWQFNKQQVTLDSSPSQNDMDQVAQLGPGHGSEGHSAYYTSEKFSSIPHIEEYNIPVFTVTIWIYPLSSSPQFTSIFRKGSDDSEYTPSLILYPSVDDANVGGGQLEAVVSTSQGKESIKSQGSIPGRRWSHIAITLQYNLIQLYVNGVLGSQKTLQSQPILNKGPLYLGGDIWYPGPVMYIDDFFIFNKALLQMDILKLSLQPGHINQKTYYLGCDACSYHEAVTSCTSGWHLCSASELYANAYQYARTQGWLRTAMDVWGRIDVMDEQLVKDYLNPKLSKAGICCLDNFY